MVQLTEQNRDPAKSKRSQAALEYLTNYSWAILIIAIVVVLFYFYAKVPSTLPNTCNFASGFYCKDITLQSNSLTHTTLVTVLLVNSQQFAVKDPRLFVAINSENTTAAQCNPTFDPAGSAMICSVDVPIETEIGTLLSGDLYLDTIYCGLQGNFATGTDCVGTQRETYHGTFSGHTEMPTSLITGIILTAANTTQNIHAGKDALFALVEINGYPIPGAAVNFTMNSTQYSLAPNITVANTSGVARSYIWGTTVGNVIVTAMYANMSDNITIRFVDTSSSLTSTTSTTSLITTSTTTSTSTTSTIPELPYIYCVGNINETYANRTYYAPISNTGIGTWTSTTDYPTGIMLAGCAINNEHNYIYCFGHSNLTYYAPISSTGVGAWTNTTVLPGMQVYSGCSIFNSYVYCVGTIIQNENTTVSGAVYYAPISSTGVGAWSAGAD
jgi:hypothetical protein